MYIGIDLGGTQARFGLADESENVIASYELPSGLYQATWQSTLIFGIDHLLSSAQVNSRQIKAIGVGAPDLSITFAGRKTTLRAPIKKILESKYNVPVIVENDASAAALGEWKKGAGQGIKNFLYLSLGTGIGGAAVVDGKLLKGVNRRAGEFGHMSVETFGPPCGCGNRGCLHLFASGQSIARNALQLIANRKAVNSLVIKLAGEFKDSKELASKVTAKLVIEAARQKDAIAKEVIAQALTYLSVGIASLINIFDPAIIIAGGGMTTAEDLIIQPLNLLLKKCTRPELFGEVKVITSSLGNDAGMIGAICLARELTG